MDQGFAPWRHFALIGGSLYDTAARARREPRRLRSRPSSSEASSDESVRLAWPIPDDAVEETDVRSLWGDEEQVLLRPALPDRGSATATSSKRRPHPMISAKLASSSLGDWREASDRSMDG
jgi:hypothetical protein